MSKKRTGSGGGKSKARPALLVVLAIFILLTVLALTIRCSGALREQPVRPDTPEPSLPEFNIELNETHIIA